MKTFIVGGYVRDLLLSQSGFPVHPNDRDWVVVGSSPEEMVSLGFLPVGAGFPVFLHPKTHEEYALARTERKQGRGYHGFIFHTSPDVTLEEYLRRRDLTINAMAMDAEGRIIDPYGGRRDLELRLLRHVSEAFIEDPVRILRVARFLAQLPGFRIAEETEALMAEMVHNGEADALVPERILQEFIKGLSTPNPMLMFTALNKCGLLEHLFPMLRISEKLAHSIQAAATSKIPASQILAVLSLGCSDADKASSFLNALRAPADSQEISAVLFEVSPLTDSLSQSSEAAEKLFRICDAVRRPYRVEAVLRMCEAGAIGNTALRSEDAERLRKALAAWRNIPAGSIAARQPNPRAIPNAILTARREALQSVWEADLK